MLRVALMGLILAVAAPARAAEEDGAAGPYEWSAADRQEALEACRSITPRAGLCECLLGALQAQFPSLEALVRNREKSKDRAAELEGRRCEARFGR